MARHCWVIEVPTARGGWQAFWHYQTRNDARHALSIARAWHTRKGARIVKYTPEVEDE